MNYWQRSAAFLLTNWTACWAVTRPARSARAQGHFTAGSVINAARIFTPALLALTLLWAAPAARAATFSVSTVAQLDDAIAHTQSGDTIQIAAGTYDMDKTLVFGNNVTLAGAGASTTVLDGGGKMRILEVQGNETLSGLTLRNGQENDGGAILVTTINGPASVTLTNCVLSGNSAVYSPAQVGDGEPGQGGAIFVDTGTATLTNCVLSGNDAYGTSVEDGQGGAIYSQNSNTTLTGCTLSGNGVTGKGNGGGAIFIGGHGATLVNDVVKGNTDSDNSGDEVTGIYSTLNASYCDIGGLSNLSNNFASNGGNFNDGGRNFDADPQFVRTPSTNGSGDPGDLHLQPGSPCIFRGTNQPRNYLYTDIQGVVRAITPTVGAYEGYQLLVTNTNQSGSGSLAAAVSFANGEADAVIDFDPSVFGASAQDTPKTISLGGTLTFNNNTLATIIDPAPGVVLDGGNAFQIFNITGGASVTLNGLQLRHGNAVNGFGGGLYCDSNCVAVLTDCVLAGNTAVSGGAIFNRDTAILTDCVLIGNTATYGGAVYNASSLANSFGGEATLTECTLTGNSATYGGAVCNGNNSGDSLTLTDDILWNDSASNGPEIYTFNTPVDAAFCDIKGGVTAAVSDHGSNFSADPLFVTPYSQVTNTNLHVLPGSPCVGTGTADAPDYQPADFTGAPRANPPTVGAYEGQQLVTKTGLTSSLNPSVYGQNVTFTASVVNTATGTAPGGTVQFTANGANLGGPVTLNSNGTASVSTTTLPTGTVTIGAAFTGTGFQSSSASLTQTVLVANMTTLASSLNPSVFGQSVTFTAMVDTHGGPAPQGTVQFSANGTNIGGPVTLNSNGTASVSTTTLPTGAVTIQAAFAGTGFQSSSASLAQTVLVADTTALASSQNPSPAGQSVTFTATVSTHGGPTPVGSVQFAVDGANAGGSVPLTGSQATFATSALSPGGHTVTAAFTGSGFQSSGDSLTQNVTVNVGGPQEAHVTGVSAHWGSQTVALTPGASLLPSGRGTDVPWAGIASFAVTLDIARTLTAADVTVHGVTVADYGPVTVSGSGTSYTVTLSRPISAADRVTLSLGNANVVAFSGVLPVLPGDVSGDGAVSASDMTLVKNAIGAAYSQTDDIDGSGAVDAADYSAVRARVGTKLP